MSDFDISMVCVDAEQAGYADCAVVGHVNDGEEEWVVAQARGFEPKDIAVDCSEWTVAEVGPALAIGIFQVGFVEIGGVRVDAERLDAAEAAFDRVPWRVWRRPGGWWSSPAT